MKLGADDYLAKPYRPAVLLAHVARLLQRADNAQTARIEYAGISLDVARATASCGGALPSHRFPFKKATLIDTASRTMKWISVGPV